MRKGWIVILIVLIVVLAIAPTTFACTTFCLVRNGEAIFGRNYDFEIGQGSVMTNRRGLVKTSMAGSLSWMSRYASVTFNQWGPLSGSSPPGHPKVNRSRECESSVARTHRERAP